MIRLLILAIFLLASVPAASADWPHWRGPHRNDISSEPSGWDGQSWLKDQLWQVSVGEGSSAPIVVNDRVYLTGWSNDRDTLVCLDIGTGKEQWRQAYEAPRYGRFAVGD